MRQAALLWRPVRAVRESLNDCWRTNPIFKLSECLFAQDVKLALLLERVQNGLDRRSFVLGERQVRGFEFLARFNGIDGRAIARMPLADIHGVVERG